MDRWELLNRLKKAVADKEPYTRKLLTEECIECITNLSDRLIATEKSEAVLLAACELMREWLHNDGGWSDALAEPLETIGGLSVNAIIAKAEGRST